MALAVSVGFVVDDAIVMIENIFRNMEAGMSPLRAALDGARQIGFTVVSISVSLIAAFIPLLFMGGVVGRLFREFSVTLAFAIAVSTVVSLSVTPMICAHFVQGGAEPRTPPGSTASSRACCRLDGRAATTRTLRRRAAPPRADADRRCCRHHRAHRRSLHQDAEGLFPAGRHRPDLRRHAGGGRHLLRGDGASCSSRRSTSCWPIRRSPASAPRSARPASMRRGQPRAACSSA